MVSLCLRLVSIRESSWARAEAFTPAHIEECQLGGRLVWDELSANPHEATVTPGMRPAHGA